jgi:hypothetical protein
MSTRFGTATIALVDLSHCGQHNSMYGSLSSMPKLSIGIPVCNGEEYLPELLDSLLLAGVCKIIGTVPTPRAVRYLPWDRFM